MAKPDVHITARTIDDHIYGIDIQGELTAFAEGELMAAYGQAPEGTRLVVLNFSQMRSMTSSGIGLLVTLLIRAQRRQHQLAAVGLNEHYKKIFTLTRLNEAIQVFDQETEAAATLAPPV